MTAKTIDWIIYLLSIAAGMFGVYLLIKGQLFPGMYWTLIFVWYVSYMIWSNRKRASWLTLSALKELPQHELTAHIKVIKRDNKFMIFNMAMWAIIIGINMINAFNG